MNEYQSPKPEKETSQEESLEMLDISQIVKKIENGEVAGEEEEKILREKIEDVILEEKPKEEWTAKEGKMMEAYLVGVKEGWFKDGNLTRVAVDFDLENIKFNKLPNKEEKESKIKERQEDAKEELLEREIIVTPENINNDFEKLEKKLKDKIAEETEAYENLVQVRGIESFFSKEGKEEMEDIIKALKKSNQTELNLERLEYYRLACDNKNLKFLIEKHHTEKDYTIRILEEALGAYDKILDLLNKKEKELTEEEKGILIKIFELMKKNPKITIVAVLTIFAGLGLITMYGPGFLAGLAGEEAAKEIAVETVKQAAEQEVSKKTGVGIAVGCAGLLGAIYTLVDEKKRDRFIAWLLGIGKIPDFAWWGSTHKYEQEKNKSEIRVLCFLDHTLHYKAAILLFLE